MLRPRNNFVVLRLIEKVNRQHGSLVIPATKENYTEAEVIAVGSGSISAQGGRVDTHDLRPGQLVFVQHKRQAGPQGQTAYVGIPYNVEGKSYFLFDESQIVGIIADTVGEGTVEQYTEVPGVSSVLAPQKKVILN